MITSKGYIRIRAGKYRDKYEHRRVIERLMEESWHPFYGDHIPPGMQVHHIDFSRAHNCHQNLLLLSESIHRALKKEIRCPYTGRFLSKREWERMMG